MKHVHPWGSALDVCMYCGSCDLLQREHVVPFGLNGRWVLQRASCAECARRTSQFEGSVLRGALRPVRLTLGFSSYRKADAPLTQPLEIDRGSGAEVVQLPIDEHPAIGAFPVFEPPSWLLARTRRVGIDVRDVIVVHFGAASPFDFAAALGGGQLLVSASFTTTDLARLIAKIAYGFCVSRFGLGALNEAYILPAIPGESDDIGTWVGSTKGYTMDLGLQPDERVSHAVGTDVVDGDIVAYVRLFAWAIPNEYVVVVGRAPSGHSDPHAHGRTSKESEQPGTSVTG